MSPLFLAVRAISSEFARRIFVPLVWIIGGMLLLLLILAIWLTTVEVWWWLLVVPLIIISVVYILIACIVAFAIKFLRPAQTKSQRRSVSAFVDKLQDASETIQTPKVVLLFRLAKDTIFPSEKGFISTLTSHAKSLKPDFQLIVASFKH